MFEKLGSRYENFISCTIIYIDLPYNTLREESGYYKDLYKLVTNTLVLE